MTNVSQKIDLLDKIMKVIIGLIISSIVCGLISFVLTEVVSPAFGTVTAWLLLTAIFGMFTNFVLSMVQRIFEIKLRRN